MRIENSAGDHDSDRRFFSGFILVQSLAPGAPSRGSLVLSSGFPSLELTRLENKKHSNYCSSSEKPWLGDAGPPARATVSRLSKLSPAHIIVIGLLGLGPPASLVAQTIASSSDLTLSGYMEW